MATVQGTCDPAFEDVKKLLQANIETGEELGASITVNVDGKNVVDIYGGYLDEEHTKPWTKDSIVNMWSSSKTISALAVLMLHDRGLLDVNDNVAKHWPEFAANGKENVKVRNILSHSSGVSGWSKPMQTEDLYNLKASTDQLAEQAPWWEPGTASGYHALNLGHLLGELVRRKTGKSLTQFVAEEIAGPLGADFQIGAKESDWPRIATLVPPPPLPFDLASMDKELPMVKTFANPAPNALAGNTEGWRKAEIGAANGHGNSRAMAKILSAVSLGGSVDGHKLLSPKTIDVIFEEQCNGTDIVLGQGIRWGIGFAIAGGATEESVAFLPKGKDRRICFWGGWGGSFQVMDLDKKTTMSYVMNKMGPGTTGSPRTVEYVQAIYKALE